MDQATLLAIIALAAAIHASFQLSVSMLTLVSGHALGQKARHRRVMNLMSSFTLGAMTMTTLLLCSLAYLTYVFFGTLIPILAWSVVCGLMAGVGVAVWVFYYRKQGGTALWLPRSFARMIHGRIKATEFGSEAYSLGLTSVLIEILFTLAPLTAAAFALVQLPYHYQIVGIIIYVVTSVFPLFMVTLMVGGGKKLSRIQKWREQNKRFIQFAAGSALFVLGFFIYANEVVTPLITKAVQ